MIPTSFVIGEHVPGIASLFEETKAFKLIGESFRDKLSVKQTMELNESKFAITMKNLLEEYGILDTVFVEAMPFKMSVYNAKTNFASDWHRDPLNFDLEGNYSHPVIGGLFSLVLYLHKDPSIVGGDLQIAVDDTDVSLEPLTPEVPPEIDAWVNCETKRNSVVFFSEDKLHRVSSMSIDPFIPQKDGKRISVNITCMSPSISRESFWEFC